MSDNNISKVKHRVVQAALRSGRSPDDVKILAVTKKFSAEVIRQAFADGLTDIGENYAQEAADKINELQDLNINWHFIGHLQSNKVKLIADKFVLIHTVDRIKIAQEIARQSSQTQDFLIEVNLAEESSKHGCSIMDVPQLINGVQAISGIRLRGLMFMPPLNLSLDEQRNYFSKARELREKLKSEVSSPHSLYELSMGTSHDFEVAIEEGSTIVRLGTILFGDRK